MADVYKGYFIAKAEFTSRLDVCGVDVFAPDGKPLLNAEALTQDEAVDKAKRYVDQCYADPTNLYTQIAASKLELTEIAALLRSVGIANGTTLSMVQALVEREKVLRETLRAYRDEAAEGWRGGALIAGNQYRYMALPHLRHNHLSDGEIVTFVGYQKHAPQPLLVRQADGYECYLFDHNSLMEIETTEKGA